MTISVSRSAACGEAPKLAAFAAKGSGYPTDLTVCELLVEKAHMFLDEGLINSPSAGPDVFSYASMTWDGRVVTWADVSPRRCQEVRYC